MDILQILAITGIPSTITAICFGLLSHRIKYDNQCREQAQNLLIQLSLANVDLSEATALALKNGRVNGECSEALEKVIAARAAYDKFLREVATHKIYKRGA